MTNQRNILLTLTIVAVALSSIFILASWDFKQATPFMDDQNSNSAKASLDKQATDTIPKKQNREKKIRDLDDVIDELNNVDLKVDMEKISKEIAEAMKKIDGDKIRMEVDKAIKEADFEKIKQEVETSIAKIDWDKMKAELDKVKDIDMKKLDIDMKKMEAELSKIGPEIEKSMEKAKVEIEKAKVEMMEYDKFVDGLEKDGLLKRKEGYSIKHKDGELIVNDKKVSAEVYNKYKSFLEKHKKFNISKENDDFDIDFD